MVFSLGILRFRRNSNATTSDDVPKHLTEAPSVAPRTPFRKWISRVRSTKSKSSKKAEDEDNVVTRPPTPTPYIMFAPNFSIRRKPPPLVSLSINQSSITAASASKESCMNAISVSSPRVGRPSKAAAEGAVTWSEVKSSFWEYYKQLEQKALEQQKLECILEEDETLIEEEGESEIAEIMEEVREPGTELASSPRTFENNDILCSDSNDKKESEVVCEQNNDKHANSPPTPSVQEAQVKSEDNGLERATEVTKRFSDDFSITGVSKSGDPHADLPGLQRVANQITSHVENGLSLVTPATVGESKLIRLILSLKDEKAQLEMKLLLTEKIIATQNSQVLLQECENSRLTRALLFAEKAIDERSVTSTLVCDKRRLEKSLLYAEYQIEEQNAMIGEQAVKIESLMKQISALRMKLDLYTMQQSFDYNNNLIVDSSLAVTYTNEVHPMTIRNISSESDAEYFEFDSTEYELVTPPATPARTVVNLLDSVENPRPCSEYLPSYNLSSKRSCDLMRRKSSGSTGLMKDMDNTGEMGISRLQKPNRRAARRSAPYCDTLSKVHQYL